MNKHDVSICLNNINHWNDLIDCCNLILLQDCPSSLSVESLPLDSVLWQHALCLLRVRCVMSAPCSSLPLVCFSSAGMYQTSLKGSAVARREVKHWKETKNKERNFRLEPVRRKLIQLCQDLHSSLCLL